MTLDITSLQSNFTGHLLTPSDPGYEEALRRWAINSQKRAALVTFPKTHEDIARALKFALDNKLDIAVKGGGHSASGASSTEGGVVIDLGRHFNTCELTDWVGEDEWKGKKVALVGGGARWEIVDKTAIQQGYATVGGTVNDTGCGGLILGGGYGWLSSQHGLSFDNLLEVTLVTASGNVVKANATNQELYWGVRGGGGNFGIVTEFVLKVHPQRATVWAGPVIFSPTRLAEVVEVLEEWIVEASKPDFPKNQAVQLVYTLSPDGKPVIIATLFYNGDEDDAKLAFKKLLDLGPIANMARMIPYEALNSLLNVPLSSSNYYMTGLSRENLSPDAAVQIHDEVMKERAAKPELAQIVFGWEYYPLAKILEVKPDQTAFRMRTSSLGCLISLKWSPERPELHNEAKSIVRRLRDTSESILKRKTDTDNVDSNIGYGNYEVIDGTASKLFGGNYPRLQKLKKEWDPDCVFNKWCPITPAA